jgi:hypothetical protein
MASSGDRTNVTTYDNVGNPDPVIVNSTCSEVLFYENAKANTTRFRVYEPALVSTPVTKDIGESYTFKRSSCWIPGQIVGYVEILDAATASFAQEEKSQ